MSRWTSLRAWNRLRLIQGVHMSVDVRLRYLDGTSETHVRLDLGEPANGVLRQPLQKLAGSR